MPSKNILEYTGDIEIIINAGDKSLRVDRRNASIIISADTVELPDKHDGYVIHKLRKEEKLLITLITEDNLDVTQENTEVAKDNLKKKFDRNKYFGKEFPIN